MVSKQSNEDITVDSRYLAPVGSQNSRARVKWFSRKAQTRDFQDQSPTLWRLHLLNPNSMLSDNGCTYISRISADVYEHRTSNKSQQAMLYFNNYASKIVKLQVA